MSIVAVSSAQPCAVDPRSRAASAPHGVTERPARNGARALFLVALLPLLALTAGPASLGAADEPLPNLGFDQLEPGRMEVKPSFEAASYYFRAPNGTAAPYRVEFRAGGETHWRAAFEPVTDKPVGIWKGSLFDLKEDTAWEVRVVGSDTEVIPPVTFRTWSSHPPIARVVDLSRLEMGAEGLLISEQGTPDGWIKYTAPPGWRLERKYDAKDPQAAALTFRGAKYVILENVTIVGGRRHGVSVEDCESVRILNCEFSGWGRVGVQQFPSGGKRGMYVDPAGEIINWDGAININCSGRVVVERCFIHDPRGRANPWTFSHPTGPSAIHVEAARGDIVLRWNDCIGSDEHRFNDVLEAVKNTDTAGGFFRDSDISGNFAAFGNDDGVELGGGGMNVRFYRNWIEGTVCAVSTGPCFYGPQFIFGNVLADPGDENGLALMFFKNSHGLPQSGKRHFIGNTLVGPAAIYGGYGKSGLAPERLGYMRNNVFVANDARPPGEASRRDDFDHDIYWVGGGAESSGAFLASLRAIGQESHGMVAEPRFVAASEGDYRLSAESAARGRTAAVPNLAVAGDNPGAFPSDAVNVPFRPLLLTATPRKVEFSTPEKTAVRQITLHVPTDAKAVPFEIRQNDDFTWFKVTPARGVVQPGKSLTLDVTVDPAALRGRPRFRGAFLVQTSNGLSRPVVVYAAGHYTEDLRPKSAPQTIYLDASELLPGPGGVQSTAAAGVANIRYVALKGSVSTPPLVARFTVRKPGAYYVLVRAAIAGELGDRKFEIALNDGAAAAVSLQAGYHWNVGATEFRAVLLHSLGELAAGDHRLSVALRSGALQLNEFIITDTPASFFPQDWQRGSVADTR